MKSYIFKVVIQPDKFEDGRDAWHAFCPALKGCHAWGHSNEEALANIREAIDIYSKVVRWDIAFYDARKRLNDLRASLEGGAAT